MDEYPRPRTINRQFFILFRIWAHFTGNFIMMTSKHWMSQTKRGILTPRSKKLKAIDDALADFERNKSTKNQVALFDALLAWLESKKSNWKSSTRNSKTEPGGKVNRPGNSGGYLV